MDDKTWKKEYYEDCPDSLSFTAILDDKSRVLIPAPIRKKLRIKPDSIVSVIIKSLKRKIGK